jgi:hypothetical protein
MFLAFFFTAERDENLQHHYPQNKSGGGTLRNPNEYSWAAANTRGKPCKLIQELRRKTATTTHQHHKRYKNYYML